MWFFIRAGEYSGNPLAPSPPAERKHKNSKEGSLMAIHSYKNHEIEVHTRDNGDFIEASAKFKPMHGYLGTFSMWGKFSSVEAAEQTVLEEAKRIIDSRSK
jgi:hypothetical protein